MQVKNTVTGVEKTKMNNYDILAMKTRAEIIAHNFKRLRKKKQWTQEETAIQGDVSQGYIGKIENMLVDFGTEAQEKWSSIFGVDRIEFFKNPERITRGIPVIANVSAGEGISSESADQYPVGEGFEYIPLPPGCSQEEADKENIYAVKVKGDSMSPQLKNGWRLYIKPNADKSTLRNGDLVIFRDNDGTGWVKEIELADSDTLIFRSIGLGGTIIKKWSEIAVIERVYLIMT